ncbi:Uncharacterised protein [Legionella beliardensis]|uniref:Uncharacterized protein n=2 Tax=Legionella beliardensis TaxID=91822 RepID=A0A378I400_9GAMM|nr:Uncharacterised protein [Legionella beliardensis]
MLKKITTLGIFLISLASSASVLAAACPPAALPSSAAFCKSFKVSAECHCTSSGLPKSICGNMQQLYQRMLALFGSLERACAYQQETPPQVCKDSWNCYRLGGKDSTGKLCSSTGKSCK